MYTPVQVDPVLSQVSVEGVGRESRRVDVKIVGVLISLSSFGVKVYKGNTHTHTRAHTSPPTVEVWR